MTEGRKEKETSWDKSQKFKKKIEIRLDSKRKQSKRVWLNTTITLLHKSKSHYAVPPSLTGDLSVIQPYHQVLARTVKINFILRIYSL